MQGYEPYMIAARKNVPWYDERFRGQGRDRIVQTLSMAGFVSFTVHPTVYLMQQPHPVTPSTQHAKASLTYRQVCKPDFFRFMLCLLQTQLAKASLTDRQVCKPDLFWFMLCLLHTQL